MGDGGPRHGRARRGVLLSAVVLVAATSIAYATWVVRSDGHAADPLIQGFLVLVVGTALAVVLWWIGTSREAALRIADRRRREAAAIRTARQHMADLLTIGLIDVDAQGIVRFVNAPALDVLGAAAGDVVGAQLADLLAELLGEEPFGQRAPADQLVPTTTGRYVRLGSTADHRGGQLVTIEDVTDHLNEIQELNDALDAVVRERDHGHRLMATLSHEIRTPLAGIVGLARTIIADGDAADRTTADRIDRIERSGADLLRIADDALTVAAADQSALPLRPSTIDLRQHVEEVVEDVRARSQSDLDVRVRVSGPTDAVVIDSARLRQIIGNLVENALRHTSAGYVDVTADVRGTTCTIVVSDTGEGIPAAKLDRVFDPFTQVDESASRVGGAGLGLSVVRRVVDAMGGEIAATSVVGLGSRFRLELPVRLAEPTTAAEPVIDLGERRALLIEDDDTSALVTCAALERLGFDVERLADGRAGLELVSAGCAHDLVLVDLHLPHTDGFTIISAISRRTGQLVVAATASSHPGDLERCRLLGVDAVMQKPVASEELADLLLRSPRTARAAGRTSTIDTDQLDRLVELGVHTEVFDLLGSQIPETRAKLLGGDPEEVRLALHTLAGSMRVLGATAARERLGAAEQRLRDGGDLRSVRAEVDELIQLVVDAVEEASALVCDAD